MAKTNLPQSEWKVIFDDMMTWEKGSLIDYIIENIMNDEHAQEYLDTLRGINL